MDEKGLNEAINSLLVFTRKEIVIEQANLLVGCVLVLLVGLSIGIYGISKLRKLTKETEELTEGSTKPKSPYVLSIVGILIVLGSMLGYVYELNKAVDTRANEVEQFAKGHIFDDGQYEVDSPYYNDELGLKINNYIKGLETYKTKDYEDIKYDENGNISLTYEGKEYTVTNFDRTKQIDLSNKPLLAYSKTGRILGYYSEGTLVNLRIIE